MIPADVIFEVATREGAVGAGGFVEHWDMGLDISVVDKPGEHLGRAVARIGNELARPKAEIMDPLDHPFGGRNLRLADRCACFDVDNDSVLHVDKVIGGIAELRLPAVRRRVARCRVDGRDARRHNRSGCPEGRIIEDGKVLADCAARYIKR